MSDRIKQNSDEAASALRRLQQVVMPTTDDPQELRAQLEDYPCGARMIFDRQWEGADESRRTELTENLRDAVAMKNAKEMGPEFARAYLASKGR